MKALDVGGVYSRHFDPWRTDQTSLDCLFSAAYYTSKNSAHPSPSVVLDRLDDYETFWEMESRTPLIAGANWLAKPLIREESKAPLLEDS